VPTLNVSNVPHASELPAGAIVNVTSPDQQRRLRWGLAILLLGTTGAGVALGYVVGRGKRRKNPRRRRRKNR